MQQEFNDLIELCEAVAKEKAMQECAERAWLAMISIQLEQSIIDLVMDAIRGHLYD